MIRRRKHIYFKHLKLSSELFLVELNLQISDINCSKINTNRLCFAVLIHSVTESNTTDYYKPALNGRLQAQLGLRSFKEDRKQINFKKTETGK